MEQHTLKPYLLQGFYNWATDFNNVPLIEIKKNPNNKLPENLMNQESIILNIDINAVEELTFGNEGLIFKARFNQKIIDLFISYHSISKIFIQNTGHGLEFSTFIVDNSAKNQLEITTNISKLDEYKSNLQHRSLEEKKEDFNDKITDTDFNLNKNKNKKKHLVLVKSDKKDV